MLGSQKAFIMSIHCCWDVMVCSYEHICIDTDRRRHGPYSHKVTERIECNIVIHLPTSMDLKAGTELFETSERYNMIIKMTVPHSYLTCAIWSTEAISHHKTSRACASRWSRCKFMFLQLTFYSSDTHTTNVNVRYCGVAADRPWWQWFPTN